MSTATASRAPADVNYTFSDAELAALMPYGEARWHEEGEVLVSEGERGGDCLVTLSGETHIFVDDMDGPVRLGWMERGQFSGRYRRADRAGSTGPHNHGQGGQGLCISRFAAFQRLLVENFRPVRCVRAHAFGAARVCPGPRGLFSHRDRLGAGPVSVCLARFF